MNQIYIQAQGPGDWARFLAEPEKQWRRGYSARTLAHSWHAVGCFPPEVQNAFASSSSFRDISLLLVIPEHQVDLPGGRRPSQNDIWVLARTPETLVSIAVEGKVSEPFGPTVREWNPDGSKGRRTRFDFLSLTLGLSNVPGNIRYQLLHRTASAVLEAQRFHAKHAVMLVHSFSQGDEWFSDFEQFAGLFGKSVNKGEIQPVGENNGIILHLGWIPGDSRFLKA